MNKDLDNLSELELYSLLSFLDLKQESLKNILTNKVSTFQETQNSIDELNFYESLSSHYSILAYVKYGVKVETIDNKVNIADISWIIKSSREIETQNGGAYKTLCEHFEVSDINELALKLTQ